jgi:cGMP-dependent protein kinase
MMQDTNITNNNNNDPNNYIPLNFNFEQPPMTPPLMPFQMDGNMLSGSEGEITLSFSLTGDNNNLLSDFPLNFGSEETLMMKTPSKHVSKMNLEEIAHNNSRAGDRTSTSTPVASPFARHFQGPGLKRADTRSNFSSQTHIENGYLNIPTEFLVSSTKKSLTYIAPSDAPMQLQIDPSTTRRNKKVVLGNDKISRMTCQPTEILENVVRIPKEKTPEIINMLSEALKNHFVFAFLHKDSIEDLVHKFAYCEMKAGETVFKQGSDATLFFVIGKGTIKIVVNEHEKKTLTPGNCFGELALLFNAPRSATCKAGEDCGLWFIDSLTFKAKVEETVTKRIDENHKFVTHISIFKNLTPEQQEAISSALVREKFPAGHYIVNEEDPADSFYIIQEGSVSVTRNGVEVGTLTEGDGFGETALINYGGVRQMSVKALKETVCLALGRETLNNILGDRVHKVVFRNVQRWAVGNDSVLQNLTKLQVEKLLDDMKIRKYYKGEVVMQKNDMCTKIIIVMEGKMSCGDQTVKKGELFGSEYLLSAKTHEKLTADLVMSENGILSEMDHATFTASIAGVLEDVIKRNEKSHEKKIVVQKTEKKQPEFLLEELTFIKKIGAGQFGSVYLVQCKSKKLYALKTIAKAKIQQNNLEKHLLAEKFVLESMHFPFIVEFVASYKDSYNVYFMLEYVKGLELFEVIRDIGILNTFEAQFYTGSLILACEHMHTQNIVHRDIKPENVMVDQDGYIRLIDMGTCKVLKPGPNGAISRTFTIIGTPLYMAPEVVSNRGYIFYTDFWSLGICLYEFMCGIVPFGESLEDPYEIYEEILNKKLLFPAYLTDAKAMQIMDQLLSRTPEKRWGGSFAALKSHTWFADFDWDKLLEKQLKPPYLPHPSCWIGDDEIEEALRVSAKAVTEIIASTPKLTSSISSTESFSEAAISAEEPWDIDF